MATLVFGALGSALGGPLGGAIGSLIGRAIDREIIGVSEREGARLKELAVSTSSYGQPIARVFGTTRAAGTIIWATDLVESRETVSGGKGQPRTAQYRYSISLAIALSSRPIAGVGRIWADGNLLRGAAGDFKTGGALRVHTGHGDQDPDPLLAAALGGQCPAHRGLAYAVIEDLQLGDFGNRIPALSFEVLADGAGTALIDALLEPVDGAVGGGSLPATAAVEGFAHEGGGVASALGNLGAVVAMTADSAGSGVKLGPESTGPALSLPPAIAWPDGEFGARTGQRAIRARGEVPTGLRYYDSGRDYQPGFQRAVGRAPGADERVVELPVTLAATGAAALLDAAVLRASYGAERARVRIASLDPVFAPGRLVELAGSEWRVGGWEWREGGVELDLTRACDQPALAPRGDAGTPWSPADRAAGETLVHAFELPWDGGGAPDAARLHVAVGATAGWWAGAALYAERAGSLVPLGSAGPARAFIASLAAPLGGSPALMFEPASAFEMVCPDPDAVFATVDGAALAAGANRMLIGEEILQFMRAEPLGGGLWRLSGLLRGRGATEAAARHGHPADTPAILLDERVLLFDGAVVDSAHERLAAIGNGNMDPVFAAVAAPGRSRQSLPPVHPSARTNPDGSIALAWTRRARGAWAWADGVDVPLIEEAEAYQLGAGPVAAPLAAWKVSAPALVLAAQDLAALPAGTPLWVRQIGRHALSPALLLHTLA